MLHLPNSAGLFKNVPRTEAHVHFAPLPIFLGLFIIVSQASCRNVSQRNILKHVYQETLIF